jgi:hypothetical protein
VKDAPVPASGWGGFPTFATHYFMPGRRPFDNLSDLSDDDAVSVMDELTSERLAGGHHRLFGRPYLLMRRETERRLRDAFEAVGRRPERTAPHYLVLGESAWFKGLAVGMLEFRVELADLKEATTSLTYGDSFEVMRVGPEFGFGDPSASQPYHSRAFRLSDLNDLVAKFGLPNDAPDEDYRGYEHRSTEKFIEVQVWTDAHPLGRELGAP